MHNSDLTEKFEYFRSRYAQSCISKIQALIDRARNKDFAREQYLPSYVNFSFDNLSGYEKAIMETFDYRYQLGDDVDEILDRIIDDVNNKIKYMHEFEDEWLEEIQDLPESERNRLNEAYIEGRKNELSKYTNLDYLLKMLVRYYAYLDIGDYFKSDEDSEKPHIGDFKISSDLPLTISWTGHGASEKLDFIKLVYGLFHADLLNNGKGEITKIVESLAYHFNVKLGKSWQSSLTRNRQERNNDYDHFRIFKEVEEGYAKYMEIKDRKS